MKWKYLLYLFLVALAVVGFIFLWFDYDCEKGVFFYGGSLQCHHGVYLDGLA